MKQSELQEIAEKWQKGNISPDDIKGISFEDAQKIEDLTKDVTKSKPKNWWASPVIASICAAFLTGCIFFVLMPQWDNPENNNILLDTKIGKMIDDKIQKITKTEVTKNEITRINSKIGDIEKTLKVLDKKSNDAGVQSDETLTKSAKTEKDPSKKPGNDAGVQSDKPIIKSTTELGKVPKPEEESGETKKAEPKKEGLIKIEPAKENNTGKTTTGRLYVTSKPPDAVVRILKINPLYKQIHEQLDPDEYDIEVSKKGYRILMTWVTIEKAKDTKVEIELTPNTTAPAVNSHSYKVYVETDPPGASVKVGGKDYQPGMPLKKGKRKHKKLKREKHRITATKEGYKDFDGELSVGSDGKELQVYIKLSPIEKKKNSKAKLFINYRPHGSKLKLTEQTSQNKLFYSGGTLEIEPGSYKVTRASDGYNIAGFISINDPGNTINCTITSSKISCLEKK